MGFLKKKSFWFTVVHLAVAGASITGAIMFPPAAPLIIGSQAMINGLIPSPLQPPKPSTTPPVPINVTAQDSVAMKDQVKGA